MSLGEKYLRLVLTTPYGTSELKVFAARIPSFPLIGFEISTTVSYSLVGCASTRGRLFENPHIWPNITMKLTEEQLYALQGMVIRQEDGRPNDTNYSIVFENAMYPFIEKDTTQTRPLVKGSVTTNADGTIQYYAAHDVVISSFEVNLSGHFYEATITLSELDKRTV